MKQDVILVLDCGATNVRAIAVDRQGKIVARASTTNASDIAAENSAWHQWSLDAILQRFADCCRSLSSRPVGVCCSRYYGDYVRRRWRAGRCAG
ncbi:L-fuculokinase [Salmonella enterica subsp. enterica]|uniref:L-fuculokinase n=1 Tax=Salmonella enterica I TaxID=59201 RepID=A0A379VL94_SALET|nr:L-fuculokinase [Salmonella enterica subsp. enterica]